MLREFLNIEAVFSSLFLPHSLSLCILLLVTQILSALFCHCVRLKCWNTWRPSHCCWYSCVRADTDRFIRVYAVILGDVAFLLCLLHRFWPKYFKSIENIIVCFWNFISLSWVCVCVYSPFNSGVLFCGVLSIVFCYDVNDYYVFFISLQLPYFSSARVFSSLSLVLFLSCVSFLFVRSFVQYTCSVHVIVVCIELQTF